MMTFDSPEMTYQALMAIMLACAYFGPLFFAVGFLSHLIGLLRFTGLKNRYLKRSGWVTDEPQPTYEDTGLGRLGKLCVKTGIGCLIVSVVLYVGHVLFHYAYLMP